MSKSVGSSPSVPQVSPRYSLVKLRQGQQAFRSELLRVFNGRCVISGCDVSQVLEAAHIMPYSQTLSNDPGNGLLLRADLHTLYDLDLIRICPQTNKVSVDVSLKDTEYWEYNDIVLKLLDQNLQYLVERSLE